MVDKEVICASCLRTSTDPPPYPKYCEHSRVRMPDGKVSHDWKLIDSLEGRAAMVARKTHGGPKA